MFSSIYVPVDYIACAEGSFNGYNSNDNPQVGYNWYQSCLSSDMASTGSVIVAPCYFNAQVAPPQLVSKPNMYYAHEYEPPPVSLPYFYSPMSSAPQLFSENCNKQSASKVFDESPSRKSMVKTQVPGPIICNVSTSLNSTNSLLQGSEPNYEAPELLSFDGTDPRSWILKVGIYINGSDAEKIYLAGSHFRGKAKVWYRCFYETRKGEVGWKKFLHDLLIRFDSFKLDNPCYLVNPLSLEQFSSVAEYEINFLQTKEISEFVYEFLFTEEILVHNFISGLKKDIRERVSLLSPMTLQGAINLAKFQALQIEKEMLFEATEEENEMGEDKAIVEEFSMVQANGTEFNQTPGGQYVQNQRNEVWNGPIGDGSFSGGSRQEKSRSEFQNDGKVLGRFDRERRVNEFCGNGSGGGNIGEVSRQPGVFSKQSISNPQSSFGRGFGVGAVQQKQNQFYGVGSSVVNGTYEQSVVHFQQSSGNYSVGNMRNVGTAQMGSSNVRKGSSVSFHGNNFYGDVGSHQQNPYGYHGNKVENYNGYTVGNTQDYQQNPNAMGSATNGGLVEANECYQPKQTVEEIDDLCQEGKLKEAIELLVLLEQQGLSVDMARYFMLMKACGEAKAVEEAKHVHDLFIGRKFLAEISSYNKILEIYCVCGSMDDAYDVFTNMPNRNLTSWDTMILWLAKNGRGKEAIDMFNRFKELGLQPDGEIFFSVFPACNLLGDVHSTKFCMLFWHHIMSIQVCFKFSCCWCYPHDYIMMFMPKYEILKSGCNEVCDDFLVESHAGDVVSVVVNVMLIEPWDIKDLVAIWSFGTAFKYKSSLSQQKEQPKTFIIEKMLQRPDGFKLGVPFVTSAGMLLSAALDGLIANRQAENSISEVNWFNATDHKGTRLSSPTQALKLYVESGNSKKFGVFFFKILALSWYWSAITLVFDPGKSDRCQVYLKFEYP